MRNHEANSLTTSAVRGVRRFHDAISGCRFDSLFGSMSDANGRIGDPPGIVVRPLDAHDERTPVLRRGP